MAQQLPNNAVDRPGNYRELFTTSGYQAGEPACLIASYRFIEAAGGGERPTGANLKEHYFALGERRPMAFLCLHRRADSGVKIRVLHCMMRYFKLSEEGGRLVDLSMALLGNIRATQMPMVEVNNSHFSLVKAGVRVPTEAVMPDRLAAALPGMTLGPYGPGTPHIEMVRPPAIQVIPTKYVATLIHRDDISSAIGSQELAGVFAAEGYPRNLPRRPNLATRRLHFTRWSGRPSRGPCRSNIFPQLLQPAAASEYVAYKVYGDLPHRQRPGGGLQGGKSDPMMMAVQQMAANVAEAGVRVARKPKGVLDAYQETYPVLL
jgi:hypothetical protein